LGLKFAEPTVTTTTTSTDTPVVTTLRMKNITIRNCNLCQGEHRRSCCPTDTKIAEKWITRTCNGRNRRKYADVVDDLIEDVDYWQKKRIYEQMTVDVEGTPDSSTMTDKQLTCQILNQLHRDRRFKEITVERKHEDENQQDQGENHQDEEEVVEDQIFALVSHSFTRYMDQFRQTKDECLKDLVKVETDAHEVFLGIRANEQQVLEHNAMPAATREWLMRTHNQERFESDMKRKLAPRAVEMAHGLLKEDMFLIKETSGKNGRMDVEWTTAKPIASDCCCICMDRKSRQDMVVLDTCNHDLCSGCVAKLMLTRQTPRTVLCPKCRTESAFLSCHYLL